MFIKTLTVSSLNSYIKRTIDNDIILSNIILKGEVSNLKIHSSGHIFFSLKDDMSKINCVMFRDDADNLKFDINEGQMVEAHGRVRVYDKEGIYQMYCSSIELSGKGANYMKFLELKEKLLKEGLFDEAHKMNLPRMPFNIGIITSPTGAAVRDIINVAERRNNAVSLLIYPSLVQGEQASQSVKEGIKYFEKCDAIDVIIIARGGGASEDLSAFNDEELAYLIYNCKKPIVTGIGHEIDFTIADFVSDMRAPTPSAAAELLIPKMDELKDRINGTKAYLDNVIDKYIKQKSMDLDVLSRRIYSASPMSIIANQKYLIDSLKKRMQDRILYNLGSEKLKLKNMNDKLTSNNPLNILEKGYSVIQDDNGRIIDSINDLNMERDIRVVFKDGKREGRFLPYKS